MEEIIQEHSNIKHSYEEFLGEVKRTVEKLLERDNISIAFSIYGRYKSIESIIEKNQSERFKIQKSIRELNDLVGLRIVLLYPEFKERAVELLLNEFQLDSDSRNENSEPNTFGYSSIHLILKSKKEWAEAPNWKHHTDKKIEVQIRTLSEHIWAETSHSLFYKREENIPKLIKRDFYKLSALLEVVDDHLQDIKNKVETHFDFIRNADYSEILKLDLNSETFRRVMVKHSKGIYNFSDYKNKALSAQIERDYNILNINVLDSLVSSILELGDINEEQFVLKVLQVLEEDKLQFDKNQEGV
jgi:putative GTP pyrophosphokinase